MLTILGCLKNNLNNGTKESAKFSNSRNWFWIYVEHLRERHILGHNTHKAAYYISLNQFHLYVLCGNKPQSVSQKEKR